MALLREGTAARLHLLGPHREIVPARVESLSDPGIDLAFQKGQTMNHLCHRPVGNPAF